MSEDKERQLRIFGWVIAILGTTVPALAGVGFFSSSSRLEPIAVYVVAALAGLAAGALAVPDSRLRVVGAIIGVAGCASASFAVSWYAAGRSSVSLIAMVLVGFVGAAPALMIGGLFYGMARDRADRG